MPLTLNLPPDTVRRLHERATQAGERVEDLALRLLEQALGTNVSASELAAVLSPVHEEFERSGMSEDELTHFLSTLRNQAYRDRQIRRVS
jgi:hypothetical protein